MPHCHRTTTYTYLLLPSLSLSPYYFSSNHFAVPFNFAPSNFLFSPPPFLAALSLSHKVQFVCLFGFFLVFDCRGLQNQALQLLSWRTNSLSSWCVHFSILLSSVTEAKRLDLPTQLIRRSKLQGQLVEGVIGQLTQENVILIWRAI